MRKIPQQTIQKFLFKCIAIVLINAFICLDFAWAASNFKTQYAIRNTQSEDSTLAPKVQINDPEFLNTISVLHEVSKILPAIYAITPQDNLELVFTFKPVKGLEISTRSIEINPEVYKIVLDYIKTSASADEEPDLKIRNFIIRLIFDTAYLRLAESLQEDIAGGDNISAHFKAEALENKDKAEELFRYKLIGLDESAEDSITEAHTREFYTTNKEAVSFIVDAANDIKSALEAAGIVTDENFAYIYKSISAIPPKVSNPKGEKGKRLKGPGKYWGLMIQVLVFLATGMVPIAGGNVSGDAKKGSGNRVRFKTSNIEFSLEKKPVSDYETDYLIYIGNQLIGRISIDTIKYNNTINLVSISIANSSGLQGRGIGAHALRYILRDYPGWQIQTTTNSEELRTIFNTSFYDVERKGLYRIAGRIPEWAVLWEYDQSLSAKNISAQLDLRFTQATNALIGQWWLEEQIQIVQYQSKLRGVIKQELPKEEKTALYIASGADVSSLFTATDASEAILVDELGFGEILDDAQIEEEAAKYMRNKIVSGWATIGNMQNCKGIGNLIIWELRAMGAQNISDVRHISDRVKEITFDWGYAGETPRKRKITFVQADAARPEQYPEELNELLSRGIDIFFQKAANGGFYDNPAIEHIISDNLRADGLVVADTGHYKKMLGEMLIPVEKPALVKTMELALAHIHTPYGVVFHIWRKELLDNKTQDTDLIGVTNMPVGQVQSLAERPYILLQGDKLPEELRTIYEGAYDMGSLSASKPKEQEQVAQALKAIEKLKNEKITFEQTIEQVFEIIHEILNDVYPKCCLPASLLAQEMLCSLGYQVMPMFINGAQFHIYVEVTDKDTGLVYLFDPTAEQFGQSPDIFIQQQYLRYKAALKTEESRETLPQIEVKRGREETIGDFQLGSHYSDGKIAQDANRPYNEVDEQRIVYILQENGPLTGKELHELTGIDLFTLWKICNLSDKVDAEFVGNRYLRFDEYISGGSRMSPAPARAFYSYSVVSLKGDKKAQDKKNAVAAKTKQDTEEKFRRAYNLILDIPAANRLNQHAAFLICGDVSHDMAHTQGRRNLRTGEQFAGSDLDIFVILDDEAPQEAVAELERYFFFGSDMLPKLYVSEVDFYVYRLSEIKRFNPDNAADMLRVKRILEGKFSFGQEEFLGMAKAILKDTGLAQEMGRLERQAAQTTAQIEEKLLTRVNLTQDDEYLFLGTFGSFGVANLFPGQQSQSAGKPKRDALGQKQDGHYHYPLAEQGDSDTDFRHGKDGSTSGPRDKAQDEPAGQIPLSDFGLSAAIPRVNQDGFAADYIIQYPNGKIFVFRHCAGELKYDSSKIRDFAAYEITANGEEIFAGGFYYHINPYTNTEGRTEVSIKSGKLKAGMAHFPFFVKEEYRNKEYRLGALLLSMAIRYMQNCDELQKYYYIAPNYYAIRRVTEILPGFENDRSSLKNNNTQAVWQEIRAGKKDTVLSGWLEIPADGAAPAAEQSVADNNVHFREAFFKAANSEILLGETGLENKYTRSDDGELVFAANTFWDDIGNCWYGNIGYLAGGKDFIEIVLSDDFKEMRKQEKERFIRRIDELIYGINHGCFILDETKARLNINILEQLRNLAGEVDWADNLAGLVNFHVTFEQTRIRHSNCLIDTGIIEGARIGLLESAKSSDERLAILKGLKRDINSGLIVPTNELEARADLHHHTIFSDGERAPAEIVYDAWKKGLTAIAIVDHNTFDGLEEALAAGDILGVRVIAGIEFSVIEKKNRVIDESFHMICYLPFQDATSYRQWLAQEDVQMFKAHIDAFRKAHYEQESVNRKLAELISKGRLIQEDVDEYLIVHGYMFLNFSGIAHILMAKHGISETDAYKEIGVNIRETGLFIEDIIRFMSGNGAVSIVAHPFKLEDAEKIKELLDKISLLLNKYKFIDAPEGRCLGIRGIEAFHWSHTDELMAEFKALIENLNASEFKDYPLIWTVGSDCHDMEKKPTKMAVGHDNIPEEASQDLLERLDEQFKILREWQGPTEVENINGLVIPGIKPVKEHAALYSELIEQAI